MKKHPIASGTAFPTIVVAIDFSGFSEAALLYATTIASHRGSRMVLLHVVDPITHAVAVDTPGYVEGVLLAAAEQRLRALSRQLEERGISCQVVVREGLVRDTILHVAQEHHADLLAIGCHGHGRFDRQVLGSAAEQILRLSACPVMVAGPDTIRPEKEIFLCEHVLFPTNMDATSLATLDQVAQFTHTHHADLTLLHVMPRYTSRKAKTAAAGKLDDIAKSMQRPGLSVHGKVRTGVVSEAVLALAREGHASAILLGVRSGKDFHRGTPAGLMVELISKARCPVFTFLADTAQHRAVERIPVQREPAEVLQAG